MAATVLVYHGVEARPRDEDPAQLFVPPDLFERQMAFLARRRVVVTLDDAIRSDDARRNRVAITFDDGFRSVLTAAAPVLERFGFPATVFVPTGWLGRENGWDPHGHAPLMSAEDLREARVRGIDVQSHGHDHVDLARTGYDDALFDLGQSSERLLELLGERPRHLAYPWGRDSGEAARAARASGFEAAFTLGRRGEGAFARERVPVTPSDGDVLFAAKTSGAFLRVRWSRGFTLPYGALRPFVRAVVDRRSP